MSNGRCTHSEAGSQGRLRGERGFSITEMVVSIALISVVTLFAHEIFSTNNKVFVEQNEVVNMQQNGRVAIDRIVRDLRMAGKSVPFSRAVDSDIGTLSPVMPGSAGGGLPDTVKVLANFDNVDTDLSHSMPNESADLKVTDAGGFQVGAIAMLSGLTEEGPRGAEIFQITHVSTQGQNMLQHRQSPPWNQDQKLNLTYLAGSDVFMMSYRKYFIDDTDPYHPALMVSENEGTPHVVADNIENFQISYDLVTGEREVPDPNDPAAIRIVRVMIVARTDSPDPGWHNGINSRTGMPDHYRRVRLNANVFVRNLTQ